MDETQAASHHQMHKDDPNEWGDPLRPSKDSKRLDVVVSVRFTADEEARLREEALLTNEALSTFIRRAALNRCPATNVVAFRAVSAGGEALPTTSSLGIWHETVIAPTG